jgi:hypothetical protein
MTAQTLPNSEWTARPLRPVARWVQRTEPDGTRRLAMVWEIPDPVTSALEPATLSR